MKDFGRSWRSGVAFHSVIHAIRPELVDLERVKGRSNRENLEEAFTIAETELGIPRLLDPEGMLSNCWFICLTPSRFIYLTPSRIICLSPSRFLCLIPSRFIGLTPSMFIGLTPSRFVCLNTQKLRMTFKTLLEARTLERSTQKIISSCTDFLLEKYLPLYSGAKYSSIALNSTWTSVVQQGELYLLTIHVGGMKDLEVSVWAGDKGITLFM